MKTIGKVSLYALLALAAIGFVYQFYFSYKDRQNFPPDGRMIDVGGYALHTQIVGNGSVTVVLDAGMGDVGLAWRNVISEIDSVATVFSYDRGGLGWSESSPLPRSSGNMVQELHLLLEKAGLNAPYILVGHSLGGLNMQLFAETYPDDVVGLVLVDAEHPNVFKRMPVRSSVRRTMFKAGMWAAPIGIPRAYLSNKGTVEHALRSTTKHQHAYLDELVMARKRAAAVNTSPVSFGNLPLTVIARNHPSDSPELRDAPERTIVWAELQEELSRRSSNGTLIFSGQSQHSIHKFQPEIVANAIKTMIAVVEKER